MTSIPVTFRVSKNDDAAECVAVFLHPVHSPTMRMCYAHVGQHSECSVDWIKHRTRSATRREYADLLAELRGLYETDGDVLDVRPRFEAKPRLREVRTEVEKFAEKLADAYSTDGYRNGWRACIKMLRRDFNMNDREIEAVIRSKWTRWAADASVNRYGHHTAKDLAAYLTKMGRDLKSELAALVSETVYTQISQDHPISNGSNSK